jgi:hypothetical protein
VEDLDGEVLALLAEDLLLLLAEDLAGPVMRVDDVVADLELDRLDLTDLEALQVVFFDYLRNGALLLQAWPPPAGAAVV